MHQHMIIGADFDVADGTAEDPEDGSQQQVKVLVFVDRQTGEVFQFPQLAERAEAFARKILGIEEPEDKVDLIVPDRQPTEQELAEMAAASSGDPVAAVQHARPHLRNDPRRGPIVGGGN